MVQFVDAITHRYRLRAARYPATWARLEVQCLVCRRVFVARISPRDDQRDAWLVARARLIRTCPNHAGSFTV